MGSLKVKVNSHIKERLAISYIDDIQGGLKSLSDENYEKLKKSIIKHGFCFPLFVWDSEDDGKIYCIDGNQRLKTLRKMKDDGYSIPQLPVVFIPAESAKDAKQKLAMAASTFGSFNQDGVREFFADFDPSSLGDFAIPHLDFGSILEPDDDSLPPQETITVSEHERAKKVDLEDYEKFAHKCPKCAHEFN